MLPFFVFPSQLNSLHYAVGVFVVLSAISKGKYSIFLCRGLAETATHAERKRSGIN